jgi:rod shape-determining protein MreC
MVVRKRHAWAVFLVALFVLPVLQPTGFPGLEGAADGLVNWTARLGLGNPHAWFVPAPVEEAASPRERELEDLAIALREEYFHLAEEVAQRADLRDAAADLDRLPLAKRARVLRANDPASTRRSILIDRGSDDGVETGFAVTQGRVLVGIVRQVEAHSARVELVTDPYSRLQVAIRTRDGRRTTAWLRGGRDDDLPLRNLRGAGDLHVQVGDPVLTSNLDERVPAGLVVGHVVEASDSDVDGFLDVRIRPQMDLERSTAVLVLCPGS